ncbi:unnamed protein product [Triticum turgidum subsp. durum]|uniref:Uncharacterized protein n=1 Tax=Triticum turgidum subsp. durum TaxID=4567 RepID=A0A9R1PDY6_TRITD|nr:unnamed protein product [Triticum turgidum subsp. durum]
MPCAQEAPLPGAGRLAQGLQHPQDRRRRLAGNHHRRPAPWVPRPCCSPVSRTSETSSHGLRRHGQRHLHHHQPMLSTHSHPRVRHRDGWAPMGPRPPVRLIDTTTFPMAAGGMMYALTHRHVHEQHSFEAMSWAPADKDEPWPSPTMRWSWKSVPSPPPFAMDDVITSYALHPNGRTIFMSAHDSLYQHVPKGTFSFDTKRSEWRWHGEWALPFQGQGYYDSELGAWIGLRKDGYICACEVASRSRESAVQPYCKIAKEKLFLKVPERRLAATRATLAYMGNSNFCLVDCVQREGVEPTCVFDCCVLHMSTFGLKYDHRGELQTTRHCSNSCVVSKHILSFSPAVFWM